MNERTNRELQILGRERLRVRDLHTEKHRARANQCHFGGKNVIPSSSYVVLKKCCSVKSIQEQGNSFGIFRSVETPSY